jgi:hypothetical protein
MRILTIAALSVGVMAGFGSGFRSMRMHHHACERSGANEWSERGPEKPQTQPLVVINTVAPVPGNP